MGEGDIGTRGSPVLHQQARGGRLVKGGERAGQAGQCGGGGQRAAPAEDSSRGDQPLGRLRQGRQPGQHHPCQLPGSEKTIGLRQAIGAQLFEQRPAMTAVEFPE